MKNKIFAIFLASALCLSLCGCQLALPEGGEENMSRDRLIGCFVTTEHLDLFDFEAYFNDNAHKLVGGEVVLDGDSSAYQNRIYAEYYEETLRGEDGESHTTGGYRFPDLEGISLFAPTITDEDGSYLTSMTDTPVNDVHFGSKSHDYGTGKNDVQGIELEGTVYVPGEGGLVKFYMNPVYQSADGSVYLTAGQGLQYDAEMGGAASLLLTDEQTQSVNGGESTAYTASVKMNFDAVAVPILLRVIEMDAGSSILKTTEIDPAELPDEYEPQTGAAYLLLETVTTGDEGAEVVTRSIAGPDDEERNITVFVPVDGGYLVKAVCQVLWEE